MFTQLAKMLMLATFFPENDSDMGSDLIGEFLKTTVDLADLIGLYIVLAGIPGKGHNKVLTAGIGWATAEVLLSRALLLWVGARGAEFDWKYIQKCLDSNISLIQHIATTALIWLWSRHDLKSNLRPIVTGLLLFSSYKVMLLELFGKFLLAGPWLALLIKALVTMAVGGMTLTIYAGLAQTIGIF